jgi:hypothetical protein
MKEVEFYIVFDADGYVVGDMDKDTALDRYHDEVGNEEFTIRTIMFRLPEIERIEVTLPTSEAAVAVT